MGEKMPLVSVIIPTYNHARFVTQTVNSALAQTYPHVEVIVVDDGSVDDTRAVLDHYGQQISYLYQENRGPSAARNLGVRAARGDYFLFLDADDAVPPNKLDLQVSLLEARPDFGLVYSGWQYVDEGGTQILGEGRPGKQGQVLKELLCRTLSFPPAAAVVRRKCLERVGLFDESLRGTEDTAMWTRIAAAGYAFGYADRPLLQYRVVKGSVSSNNASQARNEFARLDKFFASPNLPADVKALEAEAYSALHYEFGAKSYHAGEIELGKDHIRKAISICPPLASDKEWLLEWIAGYALGPRVEEPRRLIELIFDNLPPEATMLRTLRRRALGRYHVATAFSSYQNHHLRRVRRHILPALWGDPTIVRNRGFVSIAVRSLFA
jgi:glycosyltransferase involved in cell wall biosynthesis